MRKIVRLTERDLTRLVKRVIIENEEEWFKIESLRRKNGDLIQDLIGKKVKVNDDGWEEEGIENGDVGTILDFGIVSGIEGCGARDLLVKFKKSEKCYPYTGLKINSKFEDKSPKQKFETALSNFIQNNNEERTDTLYKELEDTIIRYSK